MSPDATSLPGDALHADGVSIASPERSELARGGAELVELSERFFRGVFIGAVISVSLASIAALALLPTRNSVDSAGPPVTVALTALLIASAPLAIWKAAPLYRTLRRRPRLELIVLALAAALLAYPLRSELWWPACGLLMLLAMLAPLGRALAYCLAALLVNVAAHIVAGDLIDAPPVTVIGLWIGLVFWTATFGLITNRLATAILRMNIPAPKVHEPSEPVRVSAWSPSPQADAAGVDEVPALDDEGPVAAATSRLTARQLQVVALLADGLRYRDIAACLSISVRQVQRHVSNAIRRIGVEGAGELVAVAVAEGMVPARDDGADGESSNGHIDPHNAN